MKQIIVTMIMAVITASSLVAITPKEEVVIEKVATLETPNYTTPRVEPTTEAPTTEAVVIEEVTEATTETVTEDTSGTYLGNFRCTAYCGCSQCCGSYGNTTSTGAIPQANHTIAVDTSVIPYGTQVVINGITYVAEDCGGGIRGNSIDIYFATHQEALNFGVQYLDVYRK